MDHHGIAALRQIMSPEEGADEQVDWSAAEATWNTHFPTDYMTFMSVYGGGTINGEAGIFLPLSVEGTQWDPGAMAEETENVRYAWEMEGGRSALDVDPADILAWGCTSGPDILCWLTTDPDPDRWPVLVCARRGNPFFQVYPFGMSEFLRRLLLGDFDRSPISIGELWSQPAPRFVHWRLEQARWKAGLRWNGEPDPYADMFPRS